jgi:RNA ligase-like protein
VPASKRKWSRDSIVFGEWCAATHSIEYSRLPDWFLAFDVYDRDICKFLSVEERNRKLSRLGLEPIREIAQGHFAIDELRAIALSTMSSYGTGMVEGIYLRRDSGGYLQARAKIVNPQFVEGTGEHWRRRAIQWNAIVPSVGRV